MTRRTSNASSPSASKLASGDTASSSLGDEPRRAVSSQGGKSRKRQLPSKVPSALRRGMKKGLRLSSSKGSGSKGGGGKRVDVDVDVNSKRREGDGGERVLPATERNSLERTYSKIVTYSSENETITKNSLRKAFDDIVGKTFNESLFDKLFSIFDTDSDGSVNVNEFVVAMAFLLSLDSQKDNIEIAFSLFDSDFDGTIGSDEFNAMINSIFANRLSYVLNTNEGKKLFRQHLETEWSVENIKYYDAVLECCRQYGTKNELSLLKRSHSGMEAQSEIIAQSMKKRKDNDAPQTHEEILFGKNSTDVVNSRFPRTEAEQLYNTFIAQNAREQINIADATSRRIQEALAEEPNSDKIFMRPFFAAAIEIHDLMESDSFQRFKSKLSDGVNRNDVDYAREVWKTLNIPEDGGLSLEDFRSWASMNPGYFKFLEDIQKQLHILFSMNSTVDEEHEHGNAVNDTSVKPVSPSSASEGSVHLESEGTLDAKVRTLSNLRRTYSSKGSPNTRTSTLPRWKTGETHLEDLVEEAEEDAEAEEDSENNRLYAT